MVLRGAVAGSSARVCRSGCANGALSHNDTCWLIHYATHFCLVGHGARHLMDRSTGLPDKLWTPVRQEGMRLFVMKHALAVELRELAAEPSLEACAAQLRALSGAIEEPAAGERWCEVDLFAVFSPEETVRPVPHRSRWARVLNVLDLVQPVMVFVPIVITWFGLQHATSAYREAISAGGAEAARRPFLEMWQQGFDGRLSEFMRFDAIAFATLAAIILLIVIVLLERLLRRKIESHAELRAEELRSRLRAALTEATLTLGQVRLSSPARFQAELTKSAMEISEVGSTLRLLQEKTVASLEASLESTRQAMEGLREATADIQAAAGKLDEHLTSVTRATTDLTQTVDRTTYAIDKVGEKAEAAMEQARDRLGVLVADTTSGIRAAMEEAATRVGTGVHEATKELDGHVGQLTQRVNELATVGTTRADFPVCTWSSPGLLRSSTAPRASSRARRWHSGWPWTSAAIRASMPPALRRSGSQDWTRASSSCSAVSYETCTHKGLPRRRGSKRWSTTITSRSWHSPWQAGSAAGSAPRHGFSCANSSRRCSTEWTNIPTSTRAGTIGSPCRTQN